MTRSHPWPTSRVAFADEGLLSDLSTLPSLKSIFIFLRMSHAKDGPWEAEASGSVGTEMERKIAGFVPLFA